MGGADAVFVSALPAYSEIGVGNRDIFLEYRNSVLVYCEDEGWEEFYLRFVSRIIEGSHIEDVFCLGGKEPLKARLREVAPKGKKRIFLFDKDFDDLLGKVQSSKEVVYLSKYSIENYFIDELLLADFVLDRKKKIRRPAVLALLDFRSKMTNFMSWYPDLCRRFVLSLRYRLGLAGPKLSVWDFVKKDGSVIESWIEKYEREFRVAVRDRREWLLEDDKLELELAGALQPNANFSWIADGSEYAHFPGKHFLEFFLDSCVQSFEIDGDESSSIYAYLMASIARLEETELNALKTRVAAALA